MFEGRPLKVALSEKATPKRKLADTDADQAVANHVVPEPLEREETQGPARKKVAWDDSSTNLRSQMDNILQLRNGIANTKNEMKAYLVQADEELKALKDKISKTKAEFEERIEATCQEKTRLVAQLTQELNATE